MLELVTRRSESEVQIVDGRMRVSAALSLAGEVQCSSPGIGLFTLCRNDDGSVEARFSNGSLKRVANLLLDH